MSRSKTKHQPRRSAEERVAQKVARTEGMLPRLERRAGLFERWGEWERANQLERMRQKNIRAAAREMRQLGEDPAIALKAAQLQFAPATAEEPAQ